ncbi:DUF2971 family protein [Enterobacter sp. BIGb0383]|uniref:DUF2971 domain-containing protein n=1 Tax=unclassified Enterobacter TaxID=2608935 RepID=UPI000F49722E|nr:MULTISPECIES: DUF2971 domain-containing protein [unclassified Enterobacter]ROP62627.1 DUF2971 family protein [Enterobacter sp. BIGb0383]ROS12788.1 DUF2971 family protein [Enterobacter sp. BIGb0359]
MTRFLYKYMTLRDGFFSEPMIRATPAVLLNDPFEGRFNAEQVRDANHNHLKYYREQGKDTYDEPDDYQVRESMGLLQGDISELGIISFTESYSNPLMWAHYSNEHKGVVVEFDFNEPFFADSTYDVDGRPSRFEKDFMGTCFELPEKVDYRRELPAFKRPEFSAPDSMSDYHWNKFYKTVLFTKSIDWIYEQEQRIVVRLYDADVIICRDNEYVRATCKEDLSIKVEEQENQKIKIIFPEGYEMHEEMGDQSIKKEIYRRVTDPDAIYLFRVNPYAITSVYFGCKSAHENALKNIIENRQLGYLDNIYKMRPSDTLYQYEAERIMIPT